MSRSDPRLPLDLEGFAALMTPLEPFEPAPHVAVAVSGGADSLALLLLLDGWCRARGGRVLALTVDHGLRPEAAAEAAWVAQLCAGRGIAHRVLAWQGPHPAAALQAAARTARYHLLAAACRQAGVLHLAVAHQLEDQAETFLLRLDAGSGLEGLSAMPSVGFLDDVRLLRPLLGVPRRCLESYLRARGQAWLQDPTNRNPAYARVRLRSAAGVLSAAGLDSATSAGLAEGFGQLRHWSEGAVATLLAACCRLDPLGYAWLDRRRLLAAPEPLARVALGRLLRSLGGRRQTPRGAKLDRLLLQLRCEPPRAATLAGCRLLPRKGDRLLVVREPAAVEGGKPSAGCRERPFGQPWDGRFRPLHDDPPNDPPDDAAAPPAPLHAPPDRVPAAARPGLPPALLGGRDLDARAALPHFNAKRCASIFAPRRALTGAAFAVLCRREQDRTLVDRPQASQIKTIGSRYDRAKETQP